MSKIGFSLIILLLFSSPFLLLAQTGDEILAKAEKALSGPKDYEARASLTLGSLDSQQKELREIMVWFAGKDKRLIKFISPAGVKGIALLSNEEGMNLYLPAQNKIRLIEGNLKDEDFQGTDFSYNEIGSYEYQADYHATVTAEDTKSWSLLLTRKPTSRRIYDKLIMVVDKKNFIPLKIELYTGTTLKKVLTILETGQFGPYLIPTVVRIENLLKRHYTEMRLQNVKFDQGLEAQGIFTKRFLKKPVS